MPLNVALISLGCAKNTADSQVMAGQLIRDGLSLAPSPEDADAVVINTCSFIQSARNESLDTIREICRLKSNGRKIIVVAGCLPQKERDTVAELLPEVDAFIGVDELSKISSVIQSCRQSSRQISEISKTSTRLFEPSLPGLAFSAGAYAYVKIAEGCSHSCAFCTIPSIRGRFRSRPLRSIVGEAEKLLETGFREITLVAQDSTAYGRDLKRPSSLAKLIRAIDRIGGDFWIRFLYGFPGLITEELLETMAQSEHTCAYLDVPVQHSHPDILKSMRRAGTAKHVERLPGLARKILPGVSLRTTVICGFPGETEIHFRHLLNYLRKSRYDHIGIFPYSPEAGTPASGLKQVQKHLIERRIETLLDLQSRTFDQKADALKGTTKELIIESQMSRTKWLCRTRGQAPEVDSVVELKTSSPNIQKGDFVRGKITSHKGYTFRATQA